MQKERSAAQTVASKANGAKSKGPITDAGKANSAANSVKHGLCSKDFILEDETERRQFDQALKDLIFNHQACTEPLKRLCRRLAVAQWRQDVCDNLEGLLWRAVERGEACFEKGGAGFPGMNTINRYRARLSRDIKETKAEIAETKQLRAQAIAAEMTKAREINKPSLLQNVIDDLGGDAYETFRTNVIQESDLSNQTNPKAEQSIENNQASPIDTGVIG